MFGAAEESGGGRAAPGRTGSTSGSRPGASSRPVPQEASEAARETVLVVDDDLAVLDVACKVLGRGGFDVLRASGGEEALRLAEEAEGRIALLLTDVVMPGMGGRELAEKFQERHPDVPVLFMSAYTEDEIILQGIRLAEVNFIPKPFTVQGLREKVRAVIDQAKGGD